MKSTTYYWMAVILGGVGMGAAMGAEGTAQTTGYISGTLFAVSLVLILAAVLLARLGFAAEDRERAAKRRKYGKISRTHARNPEYPENPKLQTTLLSGPNTPHGQTSGRCAPKKWTTCGRCCKRSPGRSRMPDTVLHVMRYTVYDAKKEEPARAPTRTSPKGDEFRRPSPQK